MDSITLVPYNINGGHVDINLLSYQLCFRVVPH
jgi:hypothetical protein